MAVKIDLQLLQVTENENGAGKFSVNVVAIRNGSGEKLSRPKEFIVSSKQELKDAIRPLYQKMINAENRKDQLKTQASEALQELMEEFYPPGG